MEIQTVLAQHHGVVARRHLLGAGVRPAQVDTAIRAGRLQRLRQGWYATADGTAPDEVVIAVRAGGVLSGCSALALHGGWRLHGSQPVDVRAVRAASVRRTGVRAHALTGERRRPLGASVDDVNDAFLVAARSMGLRDLVIVGDSLHERRLLTCAQMQGIVAAESPAVRRRVARIDGIAESGTETIVRLWLQRHRIRFRAQAPIAEVGGRVDFLIGNRLILEVDSRAHHLGDRYQADRTRDRLLQSRGYLVVRVTYDDVHTNWEAAGASILAIISRDDHRAEPRGRRREFGAPGALWG